MNPMFEKDLLYPTDSLAEPGIIRVQIFDPNGKGKIPVVIESKTAHSPMNYIDTIIRIMQNDIFDRILIDIRKNVSLYISATEEIKKDMNGKNFAAVEFEGESIKYVYLDEIER
ncbi:MAG: hypothetical protein N2645_16920 [Clostridia bacterium]|nr:hypothetical protein [Clostridia bacterium]